MPLGISKTLLIATLPFALVYALALTLYKVAKREAPLSSLIPEFLWRKLQVSPYVSFD